MPRILRVFLYTYIYPFSPSYEWAGTQQLANAALQSRTPALDETPAPQHAGDFPFPSRYFKIFINALKPYFDHCLYLQTLP